MLRRLVWAFVLVTVYAEYNIFDKHERDDLEFHRSEREVDSPAKLNITCDNRCLEDLTNYTSGLNTNTSILILPKGRTVIKIDPVDMSNICPIFKKTVSCLKKCHEPEAKGLVNSFASVIFICDEYKDAGKHYKCIYDTTTDNPAVDQCTGKCVQQNVTNLNSTAESCSHFRCAGVCVENLVKNECGSDAVKLVHKTLRIQLESLKRAGEEDGKKEWPKDCASFAKEMASDKPLI